MRFSRAAAYPRIGGNANFMSTASRTKKMISVQVMTFWVNANTLGVSACSTACAAATGCSCSISHRRFIASRLVIATVTFMRHRHHGLLQERNDQSEQRRAFDQRREND